MLLNYYNFKLITLKTIGISFCALGVKMFKVIRNKNIIFTLFITLRIIQK